MRGWPMPNPRATPETLAGRGRIEMTDEQIRLLVADLRSYGPRQPLMRQAADEIDRMRAEIEDLRCSVIAFGGPAMNEWARLHELPKGHLFASHYDILARAGARMDSFTRHEVADQRKPMEGCDG